MLRRLLARTRPAVLLLASLALCNASYQQHEDFIGDGTLTVQLYDRAASLGLLRRTDEKFREFIETSGPLDGIGMYRQWSTSGDCPRNLTITDPWGEIVWDAGADTQVLQARECSWLILPGIYRDSDQYFKYIDAPVTLTFTRLRLSPLEVLEVWDPFDGNVEYTRSYNVTAQP